MRRIATHGFSFSDRRTDPSARYCACTGTWIKAVFGTTASHSRTGNCMRSLLRTSITILAALVLFGCSQEPAPATASNVTATTSYSISGTVMDEAGKAIPGVTVRLNGDTITTMTTTSDASGYYIFNGLTNGDYTVTADLSQQGLTVAPAPTVTINGALVTGINCHGGGRGYG